MNINTSLFQGQQIYLGPIDFETDPAVGSRWSHNPDFLHAVSDRPAYPQSPAEVKKRYEKMEKAIEESHNEFYFTIRHQEDKRLLGYVHLNWIEWAHGSGSLQLAIGDPAERGQGYGSQAMRLALRYAFHEINLHRLSVVVGEDNPRALAFFKRFGFVEEVRRRQALLRQGRAWDVLHLGLLQSEWQPEL